MGIDPIRYRPWSGRRAGKRERVLVIARTMFMKKMKSKWVIALMVLGYLGVWAVPIAIESLMQHESLDKETMAAQMGSGGLFMFTVLLASLICSDAISEDLRSNSFVLYFSRALRKEDYLAGKLGGTFASLALFCLLPALIMCAALMGTQSGPDYVSGLGVTGITFMAGLVATLFLVPMSLMMSALTSRKSFAAIGTFMTFIVLSIVGEIFSEFNDNWKLLDPGSQLVYLYDWMYGLGIPRGVNAPLLAAMLCAFTVIPSAVVYLRIHNRAVGK